MKEINIKSILQKKPTNTDRALFFFREYKKETIPSNKLLILKKLQMLQGRR